MKVINPATEDVVREYRETSEQDVEYALRSAAEAFAAWSQGPFGERLAAELETGAVFVNSMAGYDPRVPMGGRKASGYGRELARAGIHEFVTTKAVWVEQAQGPSEL